MARQSKRQKQTVQRVMHEYKHGELRTRGSGPKVKNPKQAIAIALHEAGASNQESSRTNKRNYRRTKSKERRGATAQAAAEGHSAQRRTMSAAGRRRGTDGQTKAKLYAEARRRNIQGRSRMSKAELARAIGRRKG